MYESCKGWGGNLNGLSLGGYGLEVWVWWLDLEIVVLELFI